MKREFVMLMKKLIGTVDPSRWLVSEKFDGQRCFWDGGVTRGMLKADVPWANTQKDERYIEAQVATGLWSRYGNVIHAPDWWLDGLPAMLLDGELWMGRGTFNECRTVISRLPSNRLDSEWKRVDYKVFDSPSPWAFCSVGRINNPNWEEFHFPARESLALFDVAKVRTWTDTLTLLDESRLKAQGDETHDSWSLVAQEQLAMNPWTMLAGMPPEAEGLIIRRKDSRWVPQRVDTVLKVILEKVGHGKVVGWNDGEGRLDGMIGSLDIEWDGAPFRLSGMTDAKRAHGTWSVGDKVRFEYMETTPDGKPRNPRIK